MSRLLAFPAAADRPRLRGVAVAPSAHHSRLPGAAQQLLSSVAERLDRMVRDRPDAAAQLLVDMDLLMRHVYGAPEPANAHVRAALLDKLEPAQHPVVAKVARLVHCSELSTAFVDKIVSGMLDELERPADD